jgi:hypothetical protein
MKLNQNHFGVTLEETIPSTFIVEQGQTKTIKLKCGAGKSVGGTPPQRPPVLIQAGIKCNSDLFYFSIPALLQVLLTRSQVDHGILQTLWMEVPSG